jgi:putative tryptophan/tyrosine transport system substrate-binding protein
MRRRDFMARAGSVIVAWPIAAFAQQSPRAKRVGILLIYAEGDPEGESRLTAFRDQLRKLGWTEGSLPIEVRWAGGNSDRMRAAATEFNSLPVDLIVVASTVGLTALRPLTGTIPIVFVQVADPVGSGFVSSYAHPGGNITGFTDYEPSIGGKWLELLKEVAPFVSRATVLTDPAQSNHRRFLSAMESTTASLGIQIATATVRERAEAESAIASIGEKANSGLIVLPGPVNNTLRETIIQQAARYRLPAIYPLAFWARDGGLLCYGNNQLDQWSKAAGYTDRILRGEKPADLPVQAPTKYDLVINLKTAKALGLNVPPTLLARADEVIE